MQSIKLVAIDDLFCFLLGHGIRLAGDLHRRHPIDIRAIESDGNSTLVQSLLDLRHVDRTVIFGAWLGRNVLRRLLAKRFGELPSGDGRGTISRELWSTEALARHGNGRHDRTEPWGLQGPVLLARRSGEFWVIDGSNRINHWAATGDTGRAVPTMHRKV